MDQSQWSKQMFQPEIGLFNFPASVVTRRILSHHNLVTQYSAVDIEVHNNPIIYVIGCTHTYFTRVFSCLRVFSWCWVVTVGRLAGPYSCIHMSEVGPNQIHETLQLKWDSRFVLVQLIMEQSRHMYYTHTKCTETVMAVILSLTQYWQVPQRALQSKWLTLF